jgi:hypothetical protein
MMGGGCGMMGQGMMGMGPGMMGPGWGMGPGMMGGMMAPGYGMMEPECGAKFQNFLDETRDLRKALHMKHFEYFEASRNPETAGESIAKLREEIRELIGKISEKAPWRK